MNDHAVFSHYLAMYARAHPGKPLQILEAGCGRHWGLDMTGIDYRLTGVDINAEAMRLRKEKVGDLDVAVVGDLRTVTLPMRTFDAIYCSFVLEHVEGAEQVMERLAEALKPGGLLLLRMPDRDSVYGWAARHTPHRTHVWYKRYLRGAKNAGTPGHGPFPVVYDSVISIAGMARFCDKRGFEILHQSANNHYVEGDFKALAPVVQPILRGFAALSGGRLTAEHNNLCYVIQRS